MLGKRSTGRRCSEVQPNTTIASDNIRMPIRFLSARRVSHILSLGGGLSGSRNRLHIGWNRRHGIEGARFDRGAGADKILAGHDDLFISHQAFDDFNTTADPVSDY